MTHWILYTLFFLGVVIELVSVYLDWRVMTGRGKTSGAWGVAFVIFVLFGLYGALLGNRRDEPFVFTRELAVALAAIGLGLTQLSTAIRRQRLPTPAEKLWATA